MIILSEKAAAQVLRMMSDQKLSPETTGLKVGVKPAGCSGLTYTLDFVQEPASGDLVESQHGVRVVLDAASADYLDGTRIDWKDGLLNAGFRFTNPQASRTCGCGESFSV